MVKIQVLVLCCVFTLPLRAQPVEDYYGMAPVRAAMSAPGLSVSFIERQIERMGDRIGIALLKIYSPEELRDEKLAEAYLPLIRMAFSYPKAITRNEDRMPDVTLFILDSLPKADWSPAVKEQAVDLISFLRSQAEKPARQ